MLLPARSKASLCFWKPSQQPDGDSDWVSSRQSGYSFAPKVGNRCWNPQKWQFHWVQRSLHSNWDLLWLETLFENYFSQLRVKIKRVRCRSWGLKGRGGSKQLTVPPIHLWYSFSIKLMMYKMFLCGFACLHALFSLRNQQMEAWDGGYLPSRSPLDCNSMSTMCRGPKRPAIC